MSEKDRLDWSDETDFESLADEPIEGFDDFDALDDFGALVEDYDPDAETESALAEEEAFTAAAEETEPESEPEAEQLPSPTTGYRGRGISGGELGVLFTFSILVAGAGIGSACLLAVGANPVSLWQPDILLDWQNYFDLEQNPLNVLALICLGVVALTLLGSRAIAKAAGGANKRTRAAEEMLDRVTNLRLENEGPWQDPAFKAFAPAATFVSETLGAWRLQAARQKHFMGIEGELHRLEKALADNSRADLTGRFDNPSVGRLSDGMIRYFDERVALTSEVAGLREKDEAASAEIMQILQDARCWHEASEQNLQLNTAAVGRLSGRLEEVSAEVTKQATADPSEAVAELKTELERMRQAEASTPDSTTVLNDLVDKSSKLAFQIAMEVARLGPRGERLAPMSQALEDLTTEFRSVSDEFNGDSGSDQLWAERLTQLSAKLAGVESALKSDDGGAWREQLQACRPAAAQLASNLADIVESYTPQAERLTNLGTNFSEFSGAAFDPADLSSGNPANPPAGVLAIEGQMPFSDESASGQDGIHQPADVDPFAVTPPARMAESPGDPSFSSSVGEPEADIFGSNLEPGEVPKFEIESSFAVSHDPFGADATPGAEVGLSDTEEKVYDLDDFGATPAGVSDLESVADGNEVYDLSDFDAQPLADVEEVVDLAELGAVRLDQTPDEADEPVYDLKQFGAVPLN